MCRGRIAQVWDTKATGKLWTLGKTGGQTAILAFSPDGNLLAALSRDGRCDV